MLLLSRSFRNSIHMKRYILLLLFVVVSLSGFSQRLFNCKNFSYKPAMDTTIDGIWEQSSDTVSVDSAYIEYPSYPNYYDLGVGPTPDLELKYKALYYDSTIYFLFRRVDDELVNGYNIDESPDMTVADSLVNRDATAIYFYFKSVDSVYKDSSVYHIDSVAWLRFVWQADDMEAQLPGGEVVNSFNEAHSEIIQWTGSGYFWSKLSINIGKLAPYLFEGTSIDTTFMRVEIELNENDKEVEPSPFEIQTRAYWGSNVGENALDNVEGWSWFKFFYNSFPYVPAPPASIRYTIENFASVYPLPASEQFTIRLDKNDRVYYYLYDITGRLVKSNNFSGIENTVEVNNLHSGTYILRIVNSIGKSMTQKVFIKN